MFEQYWNCYDYGDSWKWTKYILHFEVAMVLLEPGWNIMVCIWNVPPGSCVKGLVCIGSTIWRGGRNRRWRLAWVGRPLRISPLKAVPGLWSLPPTPLCFLVSMRKAALLSYVLLAMFCPHYGPRTIKPSRHGLKAVKPWVKINLSSF
jgi:hypothetical protein